MKNPAQFLDNPVSIKRNMMSQWETSPNKKKKIDVSEEEQETEKKHNSSVFLIDTRFCQDSELDSTVESTDDEIKEEIKEESEEERFNEGVTEENEWRLSTDISGVCSSSVCCLHTKFK